MAKQIGQLEICVSLDVRELACTQIYKKAHHRCQQGHGTLALEPLEDLRT